MNNNANKYKIFGLKNKILIMVLSSSVPFIALLIYLLLSMVNYSRAYDNIVSNITLANSYNLNFKNEIDESLYRMVARDLTVKQLSSSEEIKNPYEVIDELKEDANSLITITVDSESKSWLFQLLHNIDTLGARVDDIEANIEEGGKYDKNIEMLENNIYILTELIQDDIQYYIYYQTANIEILETHLNEKVNRIIIICAILIPILSVVVGTFAIIILRSIIINVAMLCNITEQVSEGDFSVRAEINTSDEIATLSNSVNSMIENLEMMVNTIMEDERRMRHTELRLLQEQINPHFLYNTLDTIVWLIESNKSDEAEEMVVSLSSFFRLVLSHGQEHISIADEEKHIRSYLEIQQVRYKDILDYEISIDPEIYPYEIMKLTLQPLVENALYHGIKYKRAKGLIRVDGKIIDEIIVLTVEDDGVGMDRETLNHLNMEIQRPCEETDAGFGLANVNERIRMTYGKEYGIVLESEENKGTKVTVKIPAKKYEK